jgi:hypothetical protein
MTPERIAEIRSKPHGPDVADLMDMVESQRIDLDVAETIARSFAYPGKSPFCEHSVRCAVTNDGSKNIRCLLCVEREQSKRIAQLEAEVAEFKKWIIAIDNNCKAARIWTEQCVLQTARIEAGNV